MKRLIILLSMLVLTFALSGCDDNGGTWKEAYALLLLEYDGQIIGEYAEFMLEMETQTLSLAGCLLCTI